MSSERDKLTHDFLGQVGDYINAIGGKAVVAGDVGFADDPERSGCFYLRVKVTGRKPTSINEDTRLDDAESKNR